MVMAPTVAGERENVKINNFLHNRRKACEHLKNVPMSFEK